MVLVNGFCLFHFPDIEGVAVGVVIAHCEVDRFQRVETHTGRLVLQGHLLDGRLSSEVVQDY